MRMTTWMKNHCNITKDPPLSISPLASSLASFSGSSQGNQLPSLPGTPNDGKLVAVTFFSLQVQPS